MRHRPTLAKLLVVLMVLQAHPLWADGLIRDGVGTISTGRGGTNMGYADNGAIILDNPAAMVNIDSKGLYEASVDTVITDLHYTDADPNNVHGAIRPLPLPELAYIVRSDDEDFAAGIGVFAPAGFGSDYQMNVPALGIPSERYMSIGALGKILPALSYRVTDKLSVGGTFGLALSYAQLNGPLTVQNGPFAGAPTLLDTQGTGVAPVGSLALQYLWTDDTTLGLCYTSESKFTLRGDATAEIFTPAPVFSTFNSKVNLVWPSSVAFGVKHDLCPHRRISADVIWYDWSQAFNELNMQFSSPSNLGLPPVIQNSLPLDWRDSVSLRLGYEFELDDLSIWRVGYVYHASPVPNSTLNPYLDGVLEHAFSIGYSRRYHGVLLNAAYQYSFGPDRHVGTSAIIGGDFDNSTFTAQAHWASLGITVPF